MPIIDNSELLSSLELKKFFDILTSYEISHDHFILEIREDQSSLDLNDISYIVMIKVAATHQPHQKSKSYTCPAESGTWLLEFEDDLKKGYFDKEK